jgi:hypothetical protein
LDTATGDRFGFFVALAGDTAVIGAPLDGVGANSEQGSAYVFARTGTRWTERAHLVAPDGEAFDKFAWPVALAGATPVAGAWAHGPGPNATGAAYTFEVNLEDTPFAQNDSAAVGYPSVAHAVAAALNNDQITGTEGAWRTLGAIDTGGRTLVLRSSGDLRTPPGSSVRLGGNSNLAAAAGGDMAIDGLLEGAALHLVSAASFTLGSRGVLALDSNSGLNILSASALLEGQATIGQGAYLGFSADATFLGPVQCGSVLQAGGALMNLDTFTLTAGQVSTSLFWNRSVAGLTGPSSLFGSFLNEVGAITTIRGSVFAHGPVTNNGTINGVLCSGCDDTPPTFGVDGAMVQGPGATLAMPAGSLVKVGGSFDCAIDSNSRFDLAQALLELTGAGSEQTLEVMSRDTGPGASGLDRTIAGNFPIGTLTLGAATVRLVDSRDNDPAQTTPEALYVDQLIIPPGSRLINSVKVYYNTLINNGTIDFPANAVHIGPACYPNCDASTTPPVVNTADFTCFLQQYSAGRVLAAAEQQAHYANCDGSTIFPQVNTADFTCFLQKYAAGCR